MKLLNREIIQTLLFLFLVRIHPAIELDNRMGLFLGCRNTFFCSDILHNAHLRTSFFTLLFYILFSSPVTGLEIFMQIKLPFTVLSKMIATNTMLVPCNLAGVLAMFYFAFFFFHYFSFFSPNAMSNISRSIEDHVTFFPVCFLCLMASASSRK